MGVFENTVPRVFGHNEGLHNLYISQMLRWTNQGWWDGWSM